MKFKKEYIILFIIITALSAYLATRNTGRTIYEIPEIAAIEDEHISKIEISKSGTDLLFIKDGTEWVLGPQKYKADSEKIKEIIKVIEDLTLTAVISESKAYNRYDLSDDKRINVKALDGDLLKREFAVGKAASSRKHTFVKLPGDDRVFLASADFRRDFEQTEDDFRDKEVLSFEDNDIHEIQITKAEKTITFTRMPAPVEKTDDKEEKTGEEGAAAPIMDMVWVTGEGKTGKTAEIEDLIYQLEKVRCEKYIYGKTKEDFADSIYSVKLKGGNEHTLTIFNPENNDAKNYPAISAENDSPFIFPEWRIEKIMIDPDTLIEQIEETSIAGQG